MIPPSPSCPSQRQGRLPSLLPFSPPYSRVIEAGQQVRFPVQASSFPLPAPPPLPGLPHPFFTPGHGECQTSLLPQAPGAHEIILLKSQVSQHIPLLKTLHGPSLMSELNPERLSVDMGTFKLALTSPPSPTHPCQSPNTTYCPATKSFAVPLSRGCALWVFPPCGSFCSPITPVPDNLHSWSWDHTPPSRKPFSPMSKAHTFLGAHQACIPNILLHCVLLSPCYSANTQYVLKNALAHFWKVKKCFLVFYFKCWKEKKKKKKA